MYPVYLLDDDAAVRRALSLLLSTVDIPVIELKDPQAFMAQVSRLSPGCLILDIRMPVVVLSEMVRWIFCPNRLMSRI